MRVATVKSSARRRRADAPRKGDLREQAILDAAETLFEKEGVDPVTVEQIARAAGISRASLYFYFGSKQEVIAALVARTMAVIREEAGILAEVDVPPQVTIERVIARIEKQWLEHGVVMRAAVESSPLIPEVKDLWNGTIESYIDPLAEVLVRAGVPDNRSPTGARALAKALSWMGERTFYVASTSASSEREIRRAARTVIALWYCAMDMDPTT